MKKQSKLLIGIIAAIAVLAVVAISIVMTAAGGSKDTYNSHIELAQRYLDELQYEQAIAEYEAAIAIEPKNEDAYLGLAQVYVSMGDIEKALEVLIDGYTQTGSDKIITRLKELEVEQESMLNTLTLQEDIVQWKAELALEEDAVFQSLIVALDSDSKEDLKDILVNSDLPSFIMKYGYKLDTISNGQEYACYIFDYGDTVNGEGFRFDVHGNRDSMTMNSRNLTMYYGNWVNGLAEGEGIVLNYGEGDDFYSWDEATGNWMEGFAEGEFEYKEYIFEHGERTGMWEITGALKHSFWDGKVAAKYGEDGSYEYSIFSEGVIQQVGEWEGSYNGVEGVWPAYGFDDDGHLFKSGVYDCEPDIRQGIFFPDKATYSTDLEQQRGKVTSLSYCLSKEGMVSMYLIW